METNQITGTQVAVITSDNLLDHWQGHRKLTRRVLELFPEDQLFSFSIGGMRPFSLLISEIMDLTEAGVEGVATGSWSDLGQSSHSTGKVCQSKDEFLKKWDEITEKIDQFWPLITEERLQAVEKAFGMYEAPNFATLFYFIDNEIHHRA